MNSTLTCQKFEDGSERPSSSLPLRPPCEQPHPRSHPDLTTTSHLLSMHILLTTIVIPGVLGIICQESGKRTLRSFTVSLRAKLAVLKCLPTSLFSKTKVRLHACFQPHLRQLYGVIPLSGLYTEGLEITHHFPHPLKP